jgi:hypothetical protein
MDIRQVKEERRKLAADISELINSFQQRTETAVQAIDLIHLITDASEFPVKTQVAIKVELTNN